MQVLTLQILLKRAAGHQDVGTAKLFIAAIEALQAALTAANRQANAVSQTHSSSAEAHLATLTADSFKVIRMEFQR